MRVPFHLFNLVSHWLPSRSHGIRSWLLRKCGAKLGNGVCLSANVLVYNPYIEIGDESWVSPETVFMATEQAPITIGSHCDIGPGVLITTGSHVVGGPERRAGLASSKAIIIGNGCWIGARSVILGGAIIAEGCVVAAGALVLQGHYSSNTLIAGVPATIRRKLPLSL